MKFLVGNMDNMNSYTTYKRAAPMALQNKLAGNPFSGKFFYLLTVFERFQSYKQSKLIVYGRNELKQMILSNFLMLDFLVLSKNNFTYKFFQNIF